MVSKELVAASTKPLVLAVLSRCESYGYAIIQEIREHSGGHLEWLHRMEKEKLILASWKVGENGRKRKYYRLSASGTRAIEAERQQWFAVHETLASFWGTKACLS